MLTQEIVIEMFTKGGKISNDTQIKGLDFVFLQKMKFQHQRKLNIIGFSGFPQYGY